MNAQLYSSILNLFPKNHIRFAFAYGSGVFNQRQNEIVHKAPNTPVDRNLVRDMNEKMIDFIFVVDNVIRFHDENLKHNGSHYSFVKWLGPYYLSRLQNDLGAACYFNTLVTIQLDDENYPRLIKYGVIGEKAFMCDLYDWDYLYVSGRLQKPVKIIKYPSDTAMTPTPTPTPTPTTTTAKATTLTSMSPFSSSSPFDLALRTNLMNALHTSLLIMPERFTLGELFECITSLSYTGDLRMVIGENKQKCANIVEPQMERFIKLYKPFIVKECLENVLSCDFGTGQMEQSLAQKAIYHHLNQLPKNLIQTLIRLNYNQEHYYDQEEYIYKLTNRIDYKEMVMKSISSIVKYASTVQALKGILTAGAFKSFNYSMRKLKKNFRY